MHTKTAYFRFYAELNDFLPPEKKQTEFTYHFTGKPAVKDAIEALGVPHTEVDLILINGKSVGFEYHIRHKDHISVYPVFELLDIGEVNHLREKPLRDTKFILDVHLGKLARLLRMLGFDTLYRNDYEDSEIIETAVRENRIILTRDIGILKNSAVTHGYWLRSTESEEQIIEVLDHFDLYSQIQPFHRCLTCNGLIGRVDKDDIRDELPPKIAEFFNEFYQCQECEKIYWKGSHYQKMESKIKKILEQTRSS